MKRVIRNLHPSLIVPDDEPILLARRIAEAIDTMDDVELVAIARTAVEPAHESFCHVGNHHFSVPRHFSTHRPVPDICPEHARTEHEAAVLAFHQSLFDEVTKLTGLTPRIWHSGGGTMTIIIPLHEPAPGTDWSTPCYMGLAEDHDDTGWYGSVDYYATEEHHDAGDETTVVYTGDDPQHPQEWAHQIAAHYQSLAPTSTDRLTPNALSQEPSPTQGPLRES